MNKVSGFTALFLVLIALILGIVAIISHRWMGFEKEVSELVEVKISSHFGLWKICRKIRGSIFDGLETCKIFDDSENFDELIEFFIVRIAMAIGLFCNAVALFCGALKMFAMQEKKVLGYTCSVLTGFGGAALVIAVLAFLLLIYLPNKNTIPEYQLQSGFYLSVPSCVLPVASSVVFAVATNNYRPTEVVAV